MLYIGMVLGISLGSSVSETAGMDPVRVWIAMVLLVIPGLIGARLTYVVTHWELYRRDRGRIWRRGEGGSAMMGGLPLMVVGSIPLLAALEVDFAEFWDVATFPLFCTMTFARVGCLLQGCCAGRPSESRWAPRLPDHRGVWCRRFPVRPLETAFTAAILAAALGMWPHRPFPGAVILGAVAFYSGFRFALQPHREAQESVGGVNVQQAAAAAFAILAVAGLLGGWLGAV